MKFNSFVSYRKLPIFATVFVQLIIAVLLLTASVKTTYIIYAEIIISAILVLCLIIEYLIAKKKIHEINKIMSGLDKKYLLGELLPKPSNEVEQAYFSAMKAMSHSVVGEAERAEREKNDYCEYVEAWIHEIKTPLTACSLILENGSDAAKLRRELKRADNMTETILCYARLTGAEKDRIIRSFSVAEVIDNEIKNQMSLLIAAGVGIESGGDFSVSSDDKSLAFIIGQLLINSAKYCPGCHIKITAENGVITYEDNGIGIPSHEVSRVTERGFTGTNGRSRAGSTGMGLYIVSEICRNLGITIKIESQQGEYTRFTLSFDSLTKL